MERLKEMMKNKRLVSPIWDGQKIFSFLTMNYLDFATAMGLEIIKPTNYLREVKRNQITDDSSLSYFINAPFDYGYFESELESLKNIKKEPNAIFFGGGSFGPLTIVSSILGIENTIRLIKKKPDFVKKFLDFVTEKIILLVEMENGEQDFFWLAEPVASLLAPDLFSGFCGNYLKNIFMSIEGFSILHVCGNTLKLTEECIKVKPDILSIDYCTDITKTLSEVPEEIIIMGNVDPSLLHFGTEKEVSEGIKRLLSDTEKYNNFILSTGCVIQGGTPEINMDLMFTVTEEFINANKRR